MAQLALSSVAAAAAAAQKLPNYHGCSTTHAMPFDYCNVSLSHAARVNSLMKILSRGKGVKFSARTTLKLPDKECVWSSHRATCALAG
jgi:hypothetical protein